MQKQIIEKFMMFTISEYQTIFVVVEINGSWNENVTIKRYQRVYSTRYQRLIVPLPT